MSKLIQKAGFLNPKRAGRYMNYIATRDGVELLDENADSIYMRYIATRPRAEKHGEHGLFGAEDAVDLEKTLGELKAHEGNVWTIIYSLRREDAARLGYDNAASWRALLRSKQADFAEAMQIPPSQLRWYAAFHDEGEHPHIHMMLWSDDPKYGFLRKDKLLHLQSILTNMIYADELKAVYVQKDIAYKDVTGAARETMRRIVDQLETVEDPPESIRQKLMELALELHTVNGKKQYGYLKKPLKDMVDSIVDELEKLPEVAAYYAVWNGLRDTLEGYYKSKPRQHNPLSQQKEFRAIKNAIMLDMAVAASSNLILHIPAIANEAGYDLPWWKYFDEASNEIPLLSHLAPSGPYNVKDFDLAGGMRAMLKELLPKLHGDCLTVTGHTLEENVRDAVVYNRDVIHSLDNPVMTEPGIGVLYGNLAPEGAIVKIAGVPSQLMTYKGKARVFDSLEDGIQALRAGQIHAGDCCVLRFMGLRGRFGTTAFTFQEELKGLHELYNSCAIITDGRFSGGTSGLSIGYVSPEAALGSPLGVIEEGDEVEIDIPARKLHLCISDEEMNRRLAAFHWEFPSKDYPRYLNLFVQNVGSMAKGGIWETK